MDYISSLVPDSTPAKEQIFDAELVKRPSPVREWWSDNGANEPPVPREDRQFQFGPIGFYKVPNVFVVAESVAFTRDRLLLDHSIKLGAYRKRSKLKRIQDQWSPWADEFLASDEKPIEVPGETLLGVSFGGKRVWGHWIAQNLPRCLLFLERFPNGKIAIPASYFTKHRNFGEILMKAGVDRSQLIVMPRLRSYLFETLVVVDYLYASHIIHPEGIRILGSVSKTIGGLPAADGETEAGATPERIFIPRSIVGSRAIANAPEIEALARSHGFAVVPLGARSVTEQIKMWRGAKAVVSVCGSDLTNMVFASKPICIGSLTPTWFRDIFFADLASALKCDWFELFCSVTPDEGDHSSRSVYVDPAYADTLFSAINARLASK